MSAIDHRPLDIIFVEDNRDFRESTTEMLKSIDPSIRVFQAGTARTGDALMSQQPETVVLLDLGLPDAGGAGLVADFHKRHPCAPIVVLSGLGTLDQKELTTAGAALVLEKGSDEAMGQKLYLNIRRAVTEHEVRLAMVPAQETMGRISDLIGAMRTVTTGTPTPGSTPGN